MPYINSKKRSLFDKERGAKTRDTTYIVNMMNRTQDILKASKPAASRRVPALEVKEIEIPEFPPPSGDSSLYIEEIHRRAEIVTPVLKGIPGYLPGHRKN